MRTFLTISLLMASFLAHGQSPYQIADTSKVWNTVTTGVATWGLTTCGGTKSVKFGEEVYLGDSLYLHVMESDDSLQLDWDYNGYLREDTINKLVYYAWDEYESGLIYDFGLEVGDTIHIFNYYHYFSSTLICDSIDSVLINENFKKRFFFYADYPDRYYPDEVWIEGIGSLYGVLNSGFGGSGFAGGGYSLLCCSQNDTIIYMDTFFGSCYIEEFYPQIVSDTYDTAFLNSYYEFQLIIDTADVDTFALVGEVIPEDFNFDPSTGILSGMPHDTGSFTCIITARNYEMNGWVTGLLYNDIPVVMPVNISEQSEKTKLRIYPNPCSEIINIEFDSYREVTHNLEIYNSEGILQIAELLKGDLNHLDVSTYVPGLYLVKITDENRNPIKSEKIIIE